MKKLNDILNILICASIGVFIGHGAFVFWEYKTYPDLYALYSVPWYTSIQVYGIFTIIVVTVALALKQIIRRKQK